MADDPKMVGYKPIQYYRDTDDDYSSRRIRDMPYGRPRIRGSLGPAELNFGTLETDDISSSQIVTLTNTGVDTLPVRKISVVGDYIITSDCPAELAPGQTCQIAVQFNPKRGGIISGAVYVDTGDAAGQEFVKLRGTGEGEGGTVPVEPGTDPATARFAPTALAFGSVQINTNSAIRPIVLSNTGDERLNISAITVEGDFTQTNNCGTGLDAGETCTISVRMRSTTAGLKTGAVRVAHDGSGPMAATLGGTATGAVALPVITISDGVLVEDIEPPVENPVFSLPSTTITLPTAVEGEAMEGKFRVMGSADGDIELTSLPVSGQGFTFGYAGASTGPFLPRLNYVLPAGGSLWVEVKFVEDPGIYTRTVHFVSANQDIPVVLRATVTAAPVLPGINARVRIAGNQFYSAANAQDQGGTLPAGGGLRLASVNWFGAEGLNFTPHGTWMVGWKTILDQIKSVGFNCIRLPFSGQMANNNPIPGAVNIDFDLNPEFVGKNALQIFDLIIDYCQSINMYVVLDHHRREAGAGADGAPTSGSYSEANWTAAWLVMANRYKDKINVVGADVHNEPHDLTWATWASAVERVGNAILGVAPNWIIFVEGVGHDETDHYWWGGHLKGVATRPVVLSIPHRVAYSPHEYGQSVGSQTWLSQNGNVPANWPNNLPAIWDQYWGFVFYNNIAPIWIGEMGGHFGLNPDTGVLDKPHRVEESTWMSSLVRYLNWDRNIDGSVTGLETPLAGRKGLSFAWWSWNPNSGDTGGIVRGDWATLQTPKINLIQPLLDNK